MMKFRKRTIWIACAISLIVVAALTVILEMRHAEKMAVMEQEKQLAEQERQLAEAYFRVNHAFGMVSRPWLYDSWDLDRIEEFSVYMPSPDEIILTDWFGMFQGIYLRLLMYEHKTGNALPYEAMVVYLSQEFEPDGSLRL